ncbi:MAG: diguanylate cyclase [Lachnospiraceae bacterium]|nr:diguanylate cyclase [Lachnospiraceae bacterium]
MRHILIFDNDSANLECAKIVLGSQYKLSTCSSILQCMQFLQTAMPELILLDLNMPFMDGAELISRIHADPRTEHIPVVVMTGERDPEIERKCKEIGALDYIFKPFLPDDLQIHIEQVFVNLERAGFFDAVDEQGIPEHAGRDPLTGVVNGESGWQLMDERINAGTPASLLLVGVDNLKVINNFYGMTTGDNLLKMLADILKCYTDAEDVLCRIGDDRFLVYISGVNDKNSIGRKAKGIIADMQTRLAEYHLEGSSSVSVGIALAPYDGDNLPLLYSAADKALYHVKQSGKNSMHFFSSVSTEGKGGIAGLDDLYDKLRRSDVETGSYILDYYAFQYVFNYLCRQAERGEIRLAALLLNLIPAESHLPSTEEMDKAIAVLDQSLFSCLRRSDVCSRYSNRQMILALPNTSAAELQPVIERINNDYESKMAGGKIHLQIYVKDIGGQAAQ